MKKRIYLKNSVYGSYRAKALFDYFNSSSEYSLDYNDPYYLSSPGKSILNRVFYKILRLLDSAYSLIKLSISDLVYISPMADLTIFEILVVKAFKKPVVGEFYISWYDTLINDRKTISPGTHKARLRLNKDREFVEICTHIIFLNASERSYYLKVLNKVESAEKSILIPLATERKEKASSPYANDQTSVFTACWWGTYIPLHGLEKIIEAASIVKESGLEFKFYLFGSSDEKSKPYQKQIVDLELDENVIIDNSKKFSDRSLEYFLIENCDLAFGNFGDSEKAKTVMVNKVVEAVSMGLPVLSQETAALKEYFRDGESISFCCSNPRDIAEMLIELSKDKLKLMHIADQGYKLYLNRFTKEKYFEDLDKLLSTIK